MGVEIFLISDWMITTSTNTKDLNFAIYHTMLLPCLVIIIQHSLISTTKKKNISMKLVQWFSLTFAVSEYASNYLLFPFIWYNCNGNFNLCSRAKNGKFVSEEASWCKISFSFSYFMIYSSLSRLSCSHSINFIHHLWHLPIDYVRLDEWVKPISFNLSSKIWPYISPPSAEITLNIPYPYQYKNTHTSSFESCQIDFGFQIEYFLLLWKVTRKLFTTLSSSSNRTNNRSSKNKTATWGHSLTCTLLK